MKPSAVARRGAGSGDVRSLLALLLLGAGLAAVFGQMVAVGSAIAQDAGPFLEVRPDSVVASIDKVARAQVVLRNRTDDTLHQVTLTSLTDAGVTVALPADAVVAELVPGAEHRWIVEISIDPNQQGTVAGAISFQVSYNLVQTDPERTVPRVLLADLAVTSREPEAVEEVASVEVKTATLSINERRSGWIYLIIANTSNFPITVKPVRAEGPSFVNLVVHGTTADDDADKDIPIPSGEERAVQIEVQATDVVQPGNHLLLFETPIEWTKAGQPHTENIVSTQQVEITVFGESEILTAIGVPSFLLLPGALMLLTGQVVWGWRKSEEERSRYPFPFPSPRFWLGAITLSLVTALVYPVATSELTGNRRDYLDGYGLVDIVRI